MIICFSVSRPNFFGCRVGSLLIEDRIIAKFSVYQLFPIKTIVIGKFADINKDTKTKSMHSHLFHRKIRD
jgi:hypothetical protein